MQPALEFYTDRINGFADMDYRQRRNAAAQADLDDKQHTKSTLKEIFRVKPAEGAVSNYGFKNQYGAQVQCYTLKQCVPMRNLAKRARTAKQEKASQNLARRARVNSHKNQAALLARKCVDSNKVILDTETTELYGKVISIALVDASTLEVLYDSLVFTSDAISEKAFQIHGISQDDLKDAPSFEDVCKEIAVIMAGKTWTAFNLNFDKSCLENSRHKPDAECYQWINNASVCVMYDIAVPFIGARNRHGTISLSDSLHYCGLEFEGEAHTASVDALGTAKLMQYIGEQALITHID